MLILKKKVFKFIEEKKTMPIFTFKKLRSKIASNNFQKSLPVLRVNDNNPILHRLMYEVPSAELLQGHDTSASIIKAVILFWENSGRGNFARLCNILINEETNNNACTYDLHLKSLH